MSAHLNENSLERFRLRELPPEELLAADEHLSACEVCRLKLAGAAELRGMTAALRADFARAAADEAHPAYEQFEAYADGLLRGAELRAVETHLAACADCADEARELLELRETLQTSHAETPPSSEPTPPRLRLRETPAGFWQRPFGLAPQWAALAAAVLLLASLSAWWLASKPRSAPEVAVQATPTPDVSVNANSEPTDKNETNRQVIENNNTTTAERDDVERELEGVPSQYREQVRAALKAQRLAPPPALAEVRSGAGALMGAGGGESFEVEGPAGVVSRADRPLFRWRPLAGAESYVVKVYDSDFNLVATSPQLSSREWRPPTPLPRGRVYAWQVTAKKGGAEVVAPAAPAPEARFRILSRSEEATLARAERDAAGSHLALGVLYTRAGLLAEAEAEFKALLRADPRSAAARKLLRDVQRMKSSRQ
ncbi:MAG: zf-HC2 domain-containing protein [Acidobacteria bacterium]|nr:zf-HC2 domain-containing protein [Acidobacteriota bacterium]